VFMKKIYKAYAKVNIFLKITGMRGNYHEIISRFVRVNDLYDELSFEEKSEADASKKEFQIIGNFSCKTEQNTIYKAFIALKEIVNSEDLDKLMQKYYIKVDKHIPAFAGLGGGSSDAATYLKMCNDKLNLGLSLDELSNVGVKVGADVPFFIYNYNSANVGGIGEVVEEFKEEALDFEIYTPKIEISTPKVYKSYRQNFYAPINNVEIQKFKSISSKDILQTMHLDEVNDLYKSAIKEYSELKSYYKEGYFFSGSGSSFFKKSDG